MHRLPARPLCHSAPHGASASALQDPLAVNHFLAWRMPARMSLCKSSQDGRPGGARTRTPSATRAHSRCTCTGSLTRRNGTIHDLPHGFHIIQVTAEENFGRTDLIKTSLLNAVLTMPYTISPALQYTGTLSPSIFFALLFPFRIGINPHVAQLPGDVFHFASRDVETE